MATPQRILTTKEADIQIMLAAEVHLGTKNCDFQMERYAFKRRNDGTLFLALPIYFTLIIRSAAYRVIFAVVDAPLCFAYFSVLMPFCLCLCNVFRILRIDSLVPHFEEVNYNLFVFSCEFFSHPLYICIAKLPYGVTFVLLM